jgi:hypothetical protein
MPLTSLPGFQPADLGRATAAGREVDALLGRNELAGIDLLGEAGKNLLAIGEARKQRKHELGMQERGAELEVEVDTLKQDTRSYRQQLIRNGVPDAEATRMAIEHFREQSEFLSAKLETERAKPAEIEGRTAVLSAQEKGITEATETEKALRPTRVKEAELDVRGKAVDVEVAEGTAEMRIEAASQALQRGDIDIDAANLAIERGYAEYDEWLRNEPKRIQAMDAEIEKLEGQAAAIGIEVDIAERTADAKTDALLRQYRETMTDKAKARWDGTMAMAMADLRKAETAVEEAIKAYGKVIAGVRPGMHEQYGPLIERARQAVIDQQDNFEDAKTVIQGTMKRALADNRLTQEKGPDVAPDEESIDAAAEEFEKRRKKEREDPYAGHDAMGPK